MHVCVRVRVFVFLNAERVRRGRGYWVRWGARRRRATLLFMSFSYILTRERQSDNECGDGGSCGLGQGLKYNDSLQILNLVSFVWLSFCV